MPVRAPPVSSVAIAPAAFQNQQSSIGNPTSSYALPWRPPRLGGSNLYPLHTSHFSLGTSSPLPHLTQHFLLPPSRLSVSLPPIIFLPCAPFRIRRRRQARSTRAGSWMLQVARHRRGRTRMDRERIAHVFLLQIQNQKSSIVIRQSTFLPLLTSHSALLLHPLDRQQIRRRPQTPTLPAA